MKPAQSFLVLIYILLALFVVSIIFPEEGIPLGEKLRLHFPAPYTFWASDESDYKDVSSVMDVVDADFNDTSSTLVLLPDSFGIPQTVAYVVDYKRLGNAKCGDSIFKTDSLIKQIKKKRIAADTTRKRVRSLEYPAGDKTIMYSLFNALAYLSSTNELIRILHFGDSQIEGDRITSYIRNEFQKRFGGTGNGFFPVTNGNNRNVSIQVDVSDNWKYYWIKGKENLLAEHKRFGVMMDFSRFNDFDAILKEPGKQYEATIQVKRQNISYPLSRNFKLFRLFYGNNKLPFIVQMAYDDTTLDAELVEPSDKLKILEWKFDKTPKAFTIKFTGEDSPDVFGISLDNTHGVAVDNIAIRGSRGTEFTKTNTTIFREMFSMLNVKLIIFQFGVNAVPDLLKSYSGYEAQLMRQLKFLRSLNPSVPVIVVGVSDMSRKVDDTFVSYPNIKRIRDAERRAAFATGCVFWDLYEAMGGENSMPGWVFASPPLAAKDFTHFSIPGARAVGNMFYNALMNDFNDYLLMQNE